LCWVLVKYSFLKRLLNFLPIGIFLSSTATVIMLVVALSVYAILQVQPGSAVSVHRHRTHVKPARHRPGFLHKPFRCAPQTRVDYASPHLVFVHSGDESCFTSNDSGCRFCSIWKRLSVARHHSWLSYFSVVSHHRMNKQKNSPIDHTNTTLSQRIKLLISLLRYGRQLVTSMAKAWLNWHKKEMRKKVRK